ncbi:hypothetical protein J6590_071917 [Homalodisca vitripennis]|nr:hypothetical protein J6590_071917 [Homalodisca vitripennis]
MSSTEFNDGKCPFNGVWLRALLDYYFQCRLNWISPITGGGCCLKNTQSHQSLVHSLQRPVKGIPLTMLWAGVVTVQYAVMITRSHEHYHTTPAQANLSYCDGMVYLCIRLIDVR